jgi:deoxyadenosine/deoxycytidine kinase
MWISIEGNIGCGKTTLIDKINKSNQNNFKVFKEPIEDWNDYLVDFYSKGDPFLLQTRISCSFLNIEKKLIKDDINILNEMYKLSDIDNVDYFIYLKCDVDTVVNRINKRNDNYNIDINYLNKLHKLHNNIFLCNSNKVFVIDANKDCENVYNEFNLIIEYIKNKI